MSTARVFAHLIECMYRSAYPFSNIADVIVSQIVPCPGANLVEKIFEQPIFIVSRSFAKFIKRNFIQTSSFFIDRCLVSEAGLFVPN